MAELNLEMPLVARCDIQICAYNTDKTFHAKAITVGEVAGKVSCLTFSN